MHLNRYAHLAIFLFLFLVSTLYIYPQKPPVKWGKVTEEEWELREVSYDPDAAAIMLCEFGVARFFGPKLHIEIHRRIKILKDEAINEQSDISIPYFVKDRVQDVIDVKAHTLNQAGSKTEMISVNKGDFFDSDYSENWKIKTFSFPNVKVGSIIEYRYTIASDDFIYLNNWDFENDIPTAHSEFRAIIPEYLDYRVLLQGSRLTSQYAGQSRNRWFLKNLQALAEEPYMTTLDDFRERVRFQLSGYYARSKDKDRTPEYKNLRTTWSKLNQELMSNNLFGDQLRNRPLAREILLALDLEGHTDLEKADKIYAYVQSKYKWDKRYRRFAEEELKELHRSKTGSSADINLMLCMLLINADIQASPVLISTRDHGLVTKNYPLLSQFNHIIVQVIIGDDIFLLDATDPYCPFNLLALNDLNEDGLVLSNKSEPNWIDIKPPKSNSRFFMTTIDLRNVDSPTARIEGAFKGYYARDLRQKIDQENPSLVPVKGALVETKDWEFSSLKDLSKILTISSPQVDFSPEIAGDRIYLEPLLVDYYPEHPFKTESREFPVSFGATFSELYRAEILLPEDYQLDEVPEPQLIKLPNNKGSMQYHIKDGNNKVELLIKIDINSPTFGVGLYSKLKNFFDIAVEKLSTPLVLSRYSE